MPTIKLQDSRVIFKKQKASCECCFCKNDSFSITDQNVFEITKAEHDAYKKGGTWNFTGNQTISELVPSRTPNCTSTGNESISHSENASGCTHVFGFTTMAKAVYTGPCFGNTTSFYSFFTALSVFLKYENERFYAKYVISSNVSSSTYTSSLFGYPTANFSVDGNKLIAFGNWNPSWRTYAGYQNTSSITISAQFTPDA